MFGWEFPPFNSGGLGVACDGLARALKQRGADISFVLPKKVEVNAPGVRFLFASNESGDDVVSLLLSSYKTGKGVTTEEIEGGLSLMDQVKLYGIRAKNIARNNPHDVIHAHDWLSAEAGRVAKKISGKPLVFHVHATEHDRTGGLNLNQAVYEVERRGMEDADRVVTVSNYTKEMVKRHYGIQDEKIEVVHNGVEQKEFLKLRTAEKNRQKIVLFLGRITLQKGPDYFLAAAKRVLEKRDDVLFVFAGSGDMEHRMIERAAELGISEHVAFAGFLRGDDISRMYQSADLYVMPSVSEPFGIAPLEALMEGTPVLISKQSGVSEVLPHAQSVDFWDIDRMSACILEALENEKEMKKSVFKNLEQARGLTWQRAADRVLDVYKPLVSPV